MPTPAAGKEPNDEGLSPQPPSGSRSGGSIPEALPAEKPADVLTALPASEVAPATDPVSQTLPLGPAPVTPAVGTVRKQAEVVMAEDEPEVITAEETLSAPPPAGVAQPARRPARLVRCQPVIGFYRRMLRGKLYPLTVKLVEERGGGPGRSGPNPGDPPVRVQPIIPGAIVTPAAADISADADNEATFWVLPLAKGKLKDASVEFRTRGQIVGSESITMRAGTRRLAWFLLLLTIILPVLVGYTRARVNPFDFAGWLNDRTRKVQSGDFIMTSDLIFGLLADKRETVPAAGGGFKEVVVEDNKLRRNVIENYENLYVIKYLELVVATPLLVLTIILWIMLGSARARRRGDVLEWTAG